MSYAVVTTFSPKGYEVYGRRMIESFAAFFPEDVALHAYHEGEKPSDASPRAVWRSLEDDKDRAKFMAQHTDSKDKDYRKWPVRYCHKVFAMTSAPRETDHLIWLDGDSEAFAKVNHDMLALVCADPGQAGSYLGRPYFRHTETGFWSVRKNNCGWDFLDELRRTYTLGELFNLSEWHDCMAFDYVRRKFERAGHRFKNLCPGARGLRVFEQSPLKDFITHNKGPDAKLRNYGDDMLGAA